MKPFFGVQAGDLFIATTGYTGEDGCEIVVPQERRAIWQALLDNGVAPAVWVRDALRLEAGMNLYGQDMDRVNLRSPPTWPGPWPGTQRSPIYRPRRPGGRRLPAISPSWWAW